MGLIVKFPAEHVGDDARAFLIAHIDGFIEAAELVKHRFAKAKMREIGFIAGMLRIACDEKREVALEEARELHAIERDQSALEGTSGKPCGDDEFSGEVCWPGHSAYFNFLQD